MVLLSPYFFQCSISLSIDTNLHLQKSMLLFDNVTCYATLQIAEATRNNESLTEEVKQLRATNEGH